MKLEWISFEQGVLNYNNILTGFTKVIFSGCCRCCELALKNAKNSLFGITILH